MTVEIVPGLLFYVPYYQLSTGLLLNNVVIGRGIRNVVGGTLTYYEPNIWELGILNQQNPDWRRLGLESSIIGPLPASGNTTLTPFPNMLSASIQITGGAENVTKWWGSSDVGRYGTVRAMFGAQRGPLLFINSSICLFDFSESGLPNGLEITLFEGVSAIVYILPRITMPILHYGFSSPEFEWPYPPSVL
jgi:hypothetical protein